MTDWDAEIDRKYHPVAKLFPLLDGDDFAQLKNDIAQNGLLEPIWLHEDGRIIDGRNRHRACIETRTEPRFRTWAGAGSLVSFVVSLNLHRRHLSSSQRGVVALDIEVALAKEIAEEEAERKRHQNDPTCQIVYKSEPRDALAEAAALAGTNRQYVSDAKRIQQEAPELIDLVRDGTLTIPKAKTQLRRRERVERIQEIAQGNEELDTTTRYPVIYADPPWRYEHAKTDNRAIENKYPTMTIEDICDLPVDELATPDAVLFCWATSPKLAEAIGVINAWGFTYRTSMVWVKDKIGMGYYARQRHELLLIATRGAIPVPEPPNRHDSVIEYPRLEHSAKPPVFAEIIEAMYPEYPKIELFCRERREGWAAWGNQS